MSVYTAVHRQELMDFLSSYDLGILQSYQGINGGIENSNFFLVTSSGRYILTLFERISADDARFCLNLTEHLDHYRLGCPRPLRRGDGSSLASLSGKPAAIVQYLSGSSIEQVNMTHCRAVGNWLGRMHQAGMGYPARRENTFNQKWLSSRTASLLPVLSSAQKKLLETELGYLADIDFADLPKGMIHGDLFRDNVLFTASALTGVIDFYYACFDTLLLDLAITINDWCMDEKLHLQPALTHQLLHAYNKQRPITEQEQRQLPNMLRYAALRFWISRTYDLHFPRDGEILLTKNPQIFETMLIHFRQQQKSVSELLAALAKPVSL